jgi:XTP/dITP diphosphohydrolase
MSRSLYWVLAPFLVITAVVLPLCVDSWTAQGIIMMVGLELFIVGLLIGLWDIARFEWALRIVAATVFAAYVAYLANQIMYGQLWAGRRSAPSVLSALAGLLVWGVPSFLYLIRGNRLLGPRHLIVFASSNPHKVDEVRAIFGPLGIGVIALDELSETEDPPPEPVEDGATLEENARIKAIAYARATHMLCLADDSGLEVDALGGAPGVHSARYAGVDGDRAHRDAANNAKLLRELKGVPHERRSARFVCAMCLADERGDILAETRGTFEGVITDTPAGANGFGYDPLLYLPDRDCTSAELSPKEKNARSHRGQAARAMARWLSEHSRT